MFPKLQDFFLNFFIIFYRFVITLHFVWRFAGRSIYSPHIFNTGAGLPPIRGVYIYNVLKTKKFHPECRFFAKSRLACPASNMHNATNYINLYSSRACVYIIPLFLSQRKRQHNKQISFCTFYFMWFVRKSRSFHSITVYFRQKSVLRWFVRHDCQLSANVIC